MDRGILSFLSPRAFNCNAVETPQSLLYRHVLSSTILFFVLAMSGGVWHCFRPRLGERTGRPGGVCVRTLSMGAASCADETRHLVRSNLLKTERRGSGKFRLAHATLLTQLEVFVCFTYFLACTCWQVECTGQRESNSAILLPLNFRRAAAHWQSATECFTTGFIHFHE